MYEFGCFSVIKYYLWSDNLNSFESLAQYYELDVPKKRVIRTKDLMHL